jgi:hypothetical protein
MGLGPPKVMKNAFCPATALHESAPLPFVIPSEAEGSAVQYFGPNEFVIPTEANPDFCHAPLDKVACAPFRKERRMKFAEATNLHRKSGIAQWRDLLFRGPFLEIFSTEESWACGPSKVMKNTFCPATALPGSIALPFVIPSSQLACGKLSEEWTPKKSPWVQGPEGRPPNVSPARKGWEINPEDDPSAVGAALKRSSALPVSPGAKPRDLLFCGPFLEIFSTER